MIYHASDFTNYFIAVGILFLILAACVVPVLYGLYKHAKVQEWIKESYEVEQHAAIVFWAIENKLFDNWPTLPPITFSLSQNGINRLGWEILIGDDGKSKLLAFSKDDTEAGILNELEEAIQRCLDSLQKLGPKYFEEEYMKDRRAKLETIKNKIK